MKKNLKYNLCWLVLMVAGFYLINTCLLYTSDAADDTPV